MLIIGHNSKENVPYSRQIVCDIDTDSPRKLHDMLKKATGGIDFTYISVVEDDTVIATYYDGEDFDLTETAEDDHSAASLDVGEDDDDDNLHEDDEDDDFLDEDE
jgi:hypothetical protein